MYIFCIKTTQVKKAHHLYRSNIYIFHVFFTIWNPWILQRHCFTTLAQILLKFCDIVSLSYNHIIKFHVQDEIDQKLFQGQFGWLPRNVMWLPCGHCMTNNNWNHKLTKHYSKANLDGCLEMWNGSHVDLAWLIMVGSISCANFSKRIRMKLVKVLNKPNMACMVTKMSHTYIGVD